MPQPSPRAPSPLTPVITAVAVLGALALARVYVARGPGTPPPGPVPAPPRLDDGAYVQTVAPLLRSAGCAAPTCHGGPSPGALVLHPEVTAAGLAVELPAVRARVHPGDPDTSPLYRAAVTAGHHRSTAPALDPGGCHAIQLARWIRGLAPARCAAR